MTKRALWFLVAMPLVALLSCSESDNEAIQAAKLAEGCILNTDCNTPLVCAFRRCHTECTTSRDCPKEQRCVASDRPFSVCQLEDEKHCVRSNDCPPNMVCGADRQCRDYCIFTSDCLDDQICISGTCADTEELTSEGTLPLPSDTGGTPLPPPSGTPCLYTSDCPTGLRCIASVCRPECKADIDCRKGESCVEGLCSGSGAGTGGAGNTPDGGMGGAPQPLPDHCSDGVISGNETASDCGGNCVPCPSGLGCGADADCESVKCLASICQIPTCSDGVRNGDEQGPDCGGSRCAACPNQAKPCQGQGDCAEGQVCKAGACRAGSCADGVRSGQETDADCGGPQCAPCDAKGRCRVGGDCGSGVCVAGFCAQPTCTDQVKNGTETGIDCGRDCATLCADGQSCGAGADCASGVCGNNKLCVASTCTDQRRNGAETDTDCGGSTCAACPALAGCLADSDCVTGACVANICRNKYKLTIVRQGSGTGAVSSNPGSIQCGGACEQVFVAGSSVTLTATPSQGSTFVGYSGGGCGAAVACTLTMNADVSVQATFDTPGQQGSLEWTWAPGHIYGTPAGVWDAVADADGNVYFAGGFYGGPLGAGQGTLTTSGYSGFLVKQSRTGQYLAGRKLDAYQNDRVLRLGLAPNGDVMVVADLDAAGSVEYGPPRSCPAGVVLTRLGSDLSHRWTACYGGDANQATYLEPLGGAVEQNGDLLVVGRLYGANVDFGGTTLTAGPGRYEAFLARYSAADGTLKQVIKVPSDYYEATFNTVDTDASGNVLVAGYTYGKVDFGAPVGVKGVGSVSYHDVVVAKYNSALVPVWGRVFGGANHDRPTSVRAMSNGDALLTGYYQDQMELDGAPPDVAKGGEDPFVVRLKASDGSRVWHQTAERLGGTATAQKESFMSAVESVDGNVRSVFIVGFHTSPGFDLGTGPLSYANQSNGYTEAFLVKLDAPSGALQNVWHFERSVTYYYNEFYQVMSLRNGLIGVSGYSNWSSQTQPLLDLGVGQPVEGAFFATMKR